MNLQSSNDIPKSDKTDNLNQQADLGNSEKQFHLFETIINAIKPSGKQFIEKEPGVYIHEEIDVQQSDNTDTKDTQKKQRAEQHTTGKPEEHKDISNPNDLFKTILVQTPENLGMVPFQMIFNYIQAQLPQQLNDAKPHTHHATLFTTELDGQERLDIAVQKKNNALRVTLFADGDLQQFLLDKLVALKEHLKKKKIDVDNLELDIRAIDELSQTDKDRIPLEKHKVKVLGPNAKKETDDLIL